MSAPSDTINIEAEQEQLLDELFKDVTLEQWRTVPERAASLKFYGVPTPHSRAVARRWRDAHKTVAQDDLLALVNALWAGDSHEERHLALEVMTAYPRRIPGLAWADFDQWRRGLVDWATTDHLGIAIFSPWLEADLDARIDHLWTLIADPDLWSRRLALVGVIPINRGHGSQTLPDVTLALVDQVRHERDSMIVKAVSWTLRELIRTHPDQVIAYIDEHRATLPGLVTREVNNKLRTGLKSGRQR